MVILLGRNPCPLCGENMTLKEKDILTGEADGEKYERIREKWICTFGHTHLKIYGKDSDMRTS